VIRLLLQSDDRSLQNLLAMTLGAGYSVRVEPDKDRVKALAAAEQADVLILDLDSTHASLEEALAYISELRAFRLPIVAMTDDDKRSTAMELVQHGVYDYFRKPPHLMELKLVVRRAHEHAQMKRELEATRDRLRDLTRCDQLIGASGQMRVVYDLIHRVANLNAFVLIQGESGTGKELVAQAIHNRSERAGSPFVAVSCGAIPETLIESELFGHEKGAFTGAAASREGFLEQAGDGTLFLDEMAELSLATQVKLLRVLQQKEFTRLGGKKTIPLRARVVFATHRDLASMVEQGTFRQDLFFRINVLKMEVPPLRKRPEDIPVLAEHFLETYSAGFGKPGLTIEPGAMKLLLGYDWPGNVRELENTIQRAVILAERETIGPECLPELVQALPALEMEFLSGADSFEAQMRDYKVRLALKAVSECNGNKTLAARKLSITRAYLHRLLRQGPAEIAVAVGA
jgi:DNA-binding NtrC family response regulator